jgi:kojibiose phosphorylase/nigerose phosphorylase
MSDWIIREEGFREEDIPSLENRYLIGNGYLGIRGALEEYRKDKLPAINLAGLYDLSTGGAPVLEAPKDQKEQERSVKSDMAAEQTVQIEAAALTGWREPINAPNGCYAILQEEGEALLLPQVRPLSHEMTLNYRYGIFTRHTCWQGQGGTISYTAERFADLDQVHRIGMRFRIHADYPANLELVTGIDTQVWDLNGPHLRSFQMEETESGALLVNTQTTEQSIPVSVAVKVVSQDKVGQAIVKDGMFIQSIKWQAVPNTEYVIEKWIAIYTGKDCEDPSRQAVDMVSERQLGDYPFILSQHQKSWNSLWEHADIILEQDEQATRALRYSLYHLQSIAPRHNSSLSIPARGLSGQTYKGAVFWDTEMFMLDFFLFTDPDTARSLMKYRIDTLKGAKKKAAEYVYDGAFYAWESQEGGYEACTDYNVTDVFSGRPMRTFFRDKQVHISAAVAYGILRYAAWTGDRSILDADGIRTVIECAKFYYSLLLCHPGTDLYEIHDVVGPDEYHERVNNNGYTNRMAKYTLEQAGELVRQAMEEGSLPEEYDGPALLSQFVEGGRNLYLPSPQKGEHDKVIEQFDGYFGLEDVSVAKVRSRLLHEKEYWGGAYGVASHTQVIKQADVVAWLNLFSEEFDREILSANWAYYEPRSEHGSSLSAGMYAMLACKIGEPDKAYPFFIKSALADLAGGGKEWAGMVYIGGTHPAAAGAAYMTAVRGFAGLCIEEGKLCCHPHLPAGIAGMRFKVFYQGNEYLVQVTDGQGNITKVI